MTNEHSRKWRYWARKNDRIEDIETIALFLEEKLRELNRKPPSSKEKSSASVNFIADNISEYATGGTA
jgi:hypothetical protein